MELGPENSILKMKGSETESPRIPITPAKPGLKEPESICKSAQVQLPQPNWVNIQQISAQTEMLKANCSESGSGLHNWEATVGSESQQVYRVGSESQVYGVGGMSAYNKFSMENADNWSTFSFKNLLALADAGGGAATTPAPAPAVFSAESRSSTSTFTPQMEHTHFQTIPGGNSPLAINGLFLEPRIQTVPDAPNCGIANPSALSFDLNSLPVSMTDAGSSAGISSKFVPITPDPTNRAMQEKYSRSYMPNLCTSEIAKDIDGLSEVAVTFDFDKHQITGQAELVENVSCATDSPIWEVDQEPGKGSEQLSEMGKTPQQKLRRRKHRPKVVDESKPKRTPRQTPVKPASPQGVTTVKRKYVRKNTVSRPEDSPSEGRTDGTALGTQTPIPAEMPRTKRKYVRRKGMDQPKTTPMEEGTNETNDSQAARVTRRSCRKSLNFDSENQVAEGSTCQPYPDTNSQVAERSPHQQGSNVDSQVAEGSIHQPSSKVDANPNGEISYACGQSVSTLNIEQGMNVTSEKPAVGMAYDLTHSTNKALSYLSTKTQAPCPSTPFKNEQLPSKSSVSNPNECTRGKCQIVFSDVTHDKEAINSDDQCPTRTSISNCSSSVYLTQEKQITGLKRPFSTIQEPKSCSINATGSHYNSLQVYLDRCPPNEYAKESTPSMYFPAIYKKKRSEKVYSYAASSTMSAVASENAFRSKTIPEVPAAHQGSNSNTAQLAAADGAQQERHNFECLLAMGNTERSTKKRSKGPTRVRDLASLLDISRKFPNSSKDGMAPSRIHQGNVSQGPNTCMDALVADIRPTLSTKKRSKRNVIGLAQAMMSKNVSPIDAIIQQFNHLHISEGQHALVAYHQGHARKNFLVAYQRNGTMIPFEDTFEPIRRRRPRPKVDLDDETTRVWRLLLENINSEGIDGTDDEKIKWWEGQREVFRGRADSFIARMRLVQGDRRFTPWKGSVLDSVVGVFLTQNVSDHLSSSAFISMASRFPIKASCTPASTCEEGTSEEPVVVDPDDTIEWHKRVSDQQTSDQDPMNLQDMKYNEEVEISNRNFFGDTSECIKSTENSKSPSPDSSDFGPNTYIAEQVNRLDTQNSKALPSLEGYLREFDDVMSSQNSAVSPQHSVDSIGQAANKTESCCRSSSGTEPTHNDCSTASFVELLHMAGTTMLHGIYYQGNKQEASNMDMSKKSEDTASNSQGHQEPREENELSPTEQSGLSEESAAGASFHDIAVSFGEVQKLSLGNHTSADNNPRPAEVSEAELDSKVKRQRNSDNEIPNVSGITSTVHEASNLVETVHKMNPNTSNSKRLRNGKEKKVDVDWDSLRKQAQANGKRRERTANTMDSVDWEAVRCAHVDEIAETIKERGMNNMLAERIQDFLNRMVRDHGSIDLEWLRDVPPDQAKEYLLSIRGLGLKSVECVRLLTLHHLAFPVDTNVGRIAVRLGWVPLQPLPESLQLHLLELYPVLESIQKYLWPRLCKLDQRTLYELHYQMITFGKVFCTKSKPNCNSCPMRGECRHFASAFASARLALPAPEEKSIIVSTTKDKPADRNQAEKVDHLMLPQPEPNQSLQAWSQPTSEPIIEEPATPGPIVEVPSTPEPEQMQGVGVDIEDTFVEDADEIPRIDLNFEQLNQNIRQYMPKNAELQESKMSNALVVLTPEAASIPMPKLKNISRLRTEHRVYELPDDHPLVKELDRRQPDDPCPYLLAIWRPGETIDSVQPPEKKCCSQEFGKLCNEETCFSCNSIREAKSQIVRGTLLIPCRTAMRGSFPLNGTYFQVNEVFADHESSLKPIVVPRDYLWNLHRRIVYFGTSIPTIFKGLSDKEIQYCFWRGFVCVRGFDRQVRAPRPLIARLHFPASKMTRTRGKVDES